MCFWLGGRAETGKDSIEAVIQTGVATQSKVVHLVPNLEVGGMETLVYNMVRRSRPIGAVAVICLGELGELGRALVQEGHDVVALHTAPGLKWSTIAAVRAELKKRGATTCHAHTYSPFVFGVFAKFFGAGVRLIYTEHGRLYPEVKHFKRRVLNPLLALGADHIVTISESTRKAMAHYDRLPANKIEVIWNGVDLPEPGTAAPGADSPSVKRALGLEPEHFVIGMASRLVALKNVPLALDAFAHVHAARPQARLVIAGDGEVRSSLEHRANSLKLGEAVRFLGMRDDLPFVYGAFDVFVLSSLTEGISVTLLETMSRGIPSIATRVGGNPDVVEHEATGLLVKSDNCEEMKAAMLRFVDHPEFCEQMGRGAAQRVRDHFSFDAMMDQYQERYG